MQRMVLVGSSIFAEWDTVADIHPANIWLNRAVGGTVTAYWNAHLETVLHETRPDQLWYYCGSNDINHGLPTQDIVARTGQSRQRVFQFNAAIPFVYFDVIKAPQKAGHWDQVDQINTAVRELLRPADRTIDTNAVFLENGQPVAAYFREDDLHITPAGYAALARYVAADPGNE
jgi:lysophospholipase L1-like esterase